MVLRSSPPPPAPPPDVPRAPPAPPPPPVVQKNCVLLADRVSITVAPPLVRHCARPREVCTHRNMIKGSKRLLDKAQNPPSGLESQQRRQLWFAWVLLHMNHKGSPQNWFLEILGILSQQKRVGLPIQRFIIFFFKIQFAFELSMNVMKIEEKKNHMLRIAKIEKKKIIYFSSFGSPNIQGGRGVDVVGTRVTELGSLSSGAKLAIKIFVKRLFQFSRQMRRCCA